MEGRSKRAKILQQAQIDHHHHQQLCPAAQHHHRTLPMSPKKDAPGSTSLCTILRNTMTKSSNNNLYIASSIFMLHAVQAINFTLSPFKVRTGRIG
jgi:hypothetical protein